MATKKQNVNIPAPANQAPARLIVDDGSVRKPIVNKWGDEVGEFFLRPSDMGILERFAAVQEKAAQIMNPLEGLNETSDDKTIAEALETARVEIYKLMDELLGYEGAAARLFGPVHPCTVVGGRYYMEQIMELVGGEIARALNAEAEAFAANVKKYTDAVKK